MNTFKLKISSPDGDLFDGNVTRLVVRGIEGELAIMAGHIPFVTPVVACKCKISLDEENEKFATTEGGILSITNDCVTLLSGSFVWVES